MFFIPFLNLTFVRSDSVYLGWATGGEECVCVWSVVRRTQHNLSTLISLLQSSEG